MAGGLRGRYLLEMRRHGPWLWVLVLLTPLWALAMPIYVKTPLGQTLTLNVAPSTSIEEVRAEVAAQVGLAATCVELRYAGQVLQDGRTLSDYNIQKEATLHMLSVCVDAGLADGGEAADAGPGADAAVGGGGGAGDGGGDGGAGPDAVTPGAPARGCSTAGPGPLAAAVAWALWRRRQGTARRP